MGANPTPKSNEEEATYRRGAREPSYTSPIWENYDPNHSSYVENRASAYGRYYPLERWGDEYGCGWETSSRSSIPGWRRALQDPNLAAIGLVVGAVATYLLVRAVPTSFRRKRKRNIDHVSVGDQFWSGKRPMCRIWFCQGSYNLEMASKRVSNRKYSSRDETETPHYIIWDSDLSSCDLSNGAGFW